MAFGVGVQSSKWSLLRSCLGGVFSIFSRFWVVIFAACIDLSSVVDALLARSVPDMTEEGCD